jgi:hypothetical protein
MLEIVTLEVELFVSVTTKAELVSVIWVPGNVRFVKFAVSEGVTVTIPIAEVAPVFAVIVTGVLPLTVPPVTMKVWLFVPAGTVTDAGTGTTGESPLVKVTASPPVGAFPLSTTVPVDISPEAMTAGLKDSMVMTGGRTVTPPPEEAPLGSVAVMVTAVLLATGNEVRLKVPLFAAPAMLKLAGTVAAPVFELISVTVNPAGGAGPFNVTVPTEEVPPVTEPGLNVKELITAGLTDKDPLALLAPSVAVTDTFFVVATPAVVAVKV